MALLSNTLNRLLSTLSALAAAKRSRFHRKSHTIQPYQRTGKRSAERLTRLVATDQGIIKRLEFPEFDRSLMAEPVDRPADQPKTDFRRQGEQRAHIVFDQIVSHADRDAAKLFVRDRFNRGIRPRQSLGEQRQPRGGNSFFREFRRELSEPWPQIMKIGVRRIFREHDAG